MPLPHFLMLVLAVAIAAGLTLWIALMAGVPFSVVAMVALAAAAALHYGARSADQGDGPTGTPRA